MLTGEIRNQVGAIWNAFWTGGISNPLEVTDQITYLLFIRRLDELHTLEERKSVRLNRPMDKRVFPEGKDSRGRAHDDLRWWCVKYMPPAEMHPAVANTASPASAPRAVKGLRYGAGFHAGPANQSTNTYRDEAVWVFNA